MFFNNPSLPGFWEKIIMHLKGILLEQKPEFKTVQKNVLNIFTSE